MAPPSFSGFSRPPGRPRSSNLGWIPLAGLIENGSGTGFKRMRTFGAYALVYLLKGRGRYRDALGTAVDVKAGDLIAVFPDIPHQYGPAAGETWNEVFIAFQGPLFEPWRGPGLLDPADPVWHLPEIEAWQAHFEATIADRGGFRALARLQMLIARILDARGTSADTTGAWLELATGLLEPVPNQQPSSLAQVAAKCGMSYETFRKKFSEITGHPPARFRQVRRIEQAKVMLVRGETPAKVIAAELGFSDEYHFSKTFKRLTGESPRSFRNRQS